MSEIVSSTDRTAPSIMLLEAMVRESKRSDLFKKFNIPQIPLQHHQVKVCLTINGVEVNFVKTAQEMYDRMRSRYEEDVLAEAKKLVSLTRFERLEEVLEKASFQIEQELEKAMVNANL